MNWTRYSGLARFLHMNIVTLFEIGHQHKLTELFFLNCAVSSTRNPLCTVSRGMCQVNYSMYLGKKRSGRKRSGL